MIVAGLQAPPGDNGRVAQTVSRAADHADAIETPDGLSAAEWSSIRSQYERHRHSVVAVAGQANQWRARTPNQQWTTEFDGRGFIVTPDGGGWTWGLQLLRYGIEGAERSVAASADLHLDGPRATYAWDSRIDEWFLNDRRGLEHGFTLRERPGHGAGPVVLELAVRGELAARLQASGRAIAFVTESDAAAVTYSGLTVFDANGRPIAARFEEAGDNVRIVVDDRDAVYPLTIDPLAQQAYLKASNTGAEDNFGQSVAVSGDTVVVGAPGEDSNATGVNGNQADNSAANSGAAYVFVRSGGSWTQQAYLKASNTEAGDSFGTSVAVSVDTIVVGAHSEASNATGVNGDQTDNSAPSAGAAYVFARPSDGSTWSQQAYLKASNTGGGDAFGNTVAISLHTIVVGARNEDSDATGIGGDQTNDNAGQSGAAYIFTRTGFTWSQAAYLKGSNTESDDQFGVSVAVSDETVVVGARLEASAATGVGGDQTDNSAAQAGAAYVFVRNSGTGVWSQQAYLKASNTGALDRFGESVAVSGDTVVVGAPNEDSNATGVGGDQSNNLVDGAGATYVFTRSGSTWSQQAYVKASNTGLGNAFGSSVAMSNDTVVVGVWREDSNATGINGDQTNDSAGSAGAAYVFTRIAGVWSQQAYLKASNTETNDSFGWSVAISGDTVLIGANAESSNATGINGDQTNNSASISGAAYVFLVNISVPTISDIANQTINEDVATNALAFTIGDAHTAATSLTLSGSSSNTTLVPNGNIVFGGSGANRTVTVTPAANQSGSATITVTVSDESLSASDTFTLTVDAVNDAPTISDVANRTTNEDFLQPALAVTVGDVETAASDLTMSGSSSNTTLVPNANIVFGGSGANRTVTVTPAANQNGSATITLTVSDGSLTASDTFTLTVNAVNDFPTISNVANQTINEDGATGALTITIGDVETAAADLSLSGRSSNTTLVPDANIVFGGSGANRTVTVTPAANRFGSTTITLTVSDGSATGSDPFTLTVTAVDGDPAIYALAQQAYLKSASTGIEDFLGYRVAVSGDTAVVGVPFEDSNATGIDGNPADNSATDAGAAYVFVRSAGVWTQQAYLKASNTGADDNFGYSVAVSGDTIVIGAYQEASNASGVGGNQSDNSAPDAGAAYVFTRTNGVWSQQAYLKASNPRPGGLFGSSVAIAGDTVVVGSIGEKSNATGVDGDQTNISLPGAGAAYVFTRTGSTWSQQAYLKASNTGGDNFGHSVAVSGDTAVIGAPFEDSNATGVDGNQSDDSAPDAGAAYVFTRTNGVWSQQAYLKASNAAQGDRFGESVAVSGDTVVVGAFREDSNATGVGGNQANNSALESGAAYVFARSGGGWSQQAYLKASNTGSDDQFGFSVAVAGDTVVVGAIREASNATGTGGDQTNNSLSSAGAAYVFTRSAGVWGQQAYLKASNAGFDDNFGTSVAASGSTVLVGAVGESSNATGIDGDQTNNSVNFAGAAYVFLVNLSPTITDVANQVINEDGATSALAFTIGDSDTPATGLTVSGTSANTALVPNGNIVFGGSGANRTVTVTPAANQNGSATITVTIADETLTASDTFTVTVNAVNDTPTISDVGNQAINEDGATSGLAITIGDVETAASDLTMSGSSSNTTLVPNGNIVFGGSGANRTVTVTPAANQNGSATITVTVSDGSLTASDTLTLTVTAVNDAPTITGLATQTIRKNTSTAALGITVGDIETAASSLTLSAGSSNTTVVPVGNVVFGGSGANRTVTVTPAAGQTGTVTITITVGDGTTTTGTSFELRVLPYELFTDEPLVAGQTGVRAVHITELRTRINARRSAAGLDSFVFTDPSLSGGVGVRALHITELRTALTEVYSALSMTAPSFTDATLAVGSTIIKLVHIQELRELVGALEP